MQRITLQCALLTIAVAIATQVAAVPPAEDEWTRLHTKNFELVGDISPKRLREIGVRLEGFRAALQAGQETAGQQLSVPTTIVVFKDATAFAPYKIYRDGTPAYYAGCFQPGLDRNYIGLNADPGGNPYEIIYHEYTHYFVSQRYGDVPLWLNEGLAEFYSTFRMNHHVADIGRPVERHVQYLASSGWITLESLFALDARSKDYSEGRRAGAIYAQSWALVHYLFVGEPKMKPKLQKYLELTSGNYTPTKAFPLAFGMETTQLETDLVAYLSENSFDYKQIEIPDVASEETGEVEKMSRADLFYVLGDYLAHVTPWREEDAEEHFRAAIAAADNHARAHAALGRMLELNGKWADADAHFRRAIELEPENELTLFLYGTSVLEHHMASSGRIPEAPGELPADVAAARGLLGRSIELNPHRAEGYVSLGKTYLFDPGDPQPGIAALERARGLLPARMDIPYYLMMLYLRSGNRAMAEGLANNVLVHSDESALRAMAQQVLANDDVQRANHRLQSAIDTVNKGDVDRGIAMLEQLAADPQVNELHAEIERVLAKAREARQERARIDALNRDIERYNQAIAKARAGDTAGATLQLKELAKTVSDEKLSHAIHEALQRLGAR